MLRLLKIRILLRRRLTVGKKSPPKRPSWPLRVKRTAAKLAGGSGPFRASRPGLRAHEISELA